MYTFFPYSNPRGGNINGPMKDEGAEAQRGWIFTGFTVTQLGLLAKVTLFLPLNLTIPHTSKLTYIPGPDLIPPSPQSCPKCSWHTVLSLEPFLP